MFVTYMSQAKDNMELTVSETDHNMQLTEGSRSKSFVNVSRGTSHHMFFRKGGLPRPMHQVMHATFKKTSK